MKDRLQSLGTALLFLLAFGGVGAAASWVIGATIRDAYRSARWAPVEATVRSVDGAEATYEYEWQGRAYVGDRVGTFVLGGSSEVDDWEARVAGRLAPGQAVTAWVNPADPREALLDREVRWKLLAMFSPFALGFGLVGLGMGAAHLWKAAMGPRAFPKPPKPVRDVLSSWFFGLLWNSIALPMAWFALPQLWAEGQWLFMAVAGLFAAIGLLILLGAVLGTLRLLASIPITVPRERVNRSGKVLS